MENLLRVSLLALCLLATPAFSQCVSYDDTASEARSVGVEFLERFESPADIQMLKNYFVTFDGTMVDLSFTEFEAYTTLNPANVQLMFYKDKCRTGVMSYSRESFDKLITFMRSGVINQSYRRK
mgnify:CR=1 FL=1